MSIDMSTPFDFLKTMKLSDYEHVNDFFADLHEQLDLYAIDKNKRIAELEKEREELREALVEAWDILRWYSTHSKIIDIGMENEACYEIRKRSELIEKLKNERKGV